MQEDLKAVWRELIAFYQPVPKPTDVFYAAWLKEMQAHDSADVSDMLTHVKRHNYRFPALSEQIAIVDSIAHNRQQEIWQTEKAKERRDSATFWSGQKADDFGKECLKLIRGFLSGALERPGFLQGMREQGMIDEAESLKLFYETGRSKK